MNREPRLPSHLVWDHDPSEDELTEVVGPDFLATRMHWHEDDEVIRIEAKRVSYRLVMTGMVVMCTMMSAWPYVMLWLFDKPIGVDMTTYYWILAFMWLVFLPIASWLVINERRMSLVRAPGAVIHKRTRELTLPWLDRVVREDQIVRLVDLRGRQRHGDMIASYLQGGLVFSDGEQFVLAVFARSTQPGRRSTMAGRLADFYDLPLQVIKTRGLLPVSNPQLR